MACIYYTASTLDGFVADDHDGLDWLLSRENDPDGPFGYRAFAESVGALVLGSTTYEWIRVHQPGEWPYQQPTWVLTSRPHAIDATHGVHVFDGAVTDLYPRLVEAAAGKDVWVMGGGTVAAQFVAAGLVDDVVVSYAPCSLGSGARVLPTPSEWRLVDSAVNGEFVCVRWTRPARRVD